LGVIFYPGLVMSTLQDTDTQNILYK